MKTYEKPVLNIERFVANEFISACSDTVNEYYKFECNAGGGKPGDVWEDNGDGEFNKFLDKNLTPSILNNYHACGATHYVKKGEETSVFSKGWYDDEPDIVIGNLTPVIIWKGEKGDNVHATTKLQSQIDIVQGNKS